MTALSIPRPGATVGAMLWPIVIALLLTACTPAISAGPDPANAPCGITGTRVERYRDCEARARAALAWRGIAPTFVPRDLELEY